ncbi:excalibur calcium-binding domain-containing protein [Nocardioides montaniterrae]
MKTRVIAALSVAALSSGLALSVAPSAEAASYANCTALHRDFKHGVAKSAAAAQKQVRQGYGRPAYGKRAQNIYWTVYRSMDRDKDGTACEA